MINVSNLKQAIAESRQMDPELGVSRAEYLQWAKRAENVKLVKAIVGFRRSGKSYLLKTLAKQWEDWVPLWNIFYLNFENDLLREVRNVDDLRGLWEMYLREIANAKQPIIIVWDEVQRIKEWERLVRTLYESGKYQIWISGSNSELLSGELASSLAGRCLTLQITPFSWHEYLQYRQMEKLDYHTNRVLIDREFLQYLRRGGLPEQIDWSNQVARDYARGIVDKIVLDDIVRRYKVEKVSVLTDVWEYVRGNITSILSLRRIAGLLENEGIKVAHATLDSYLIYWQKAYAISRVKKWDYKLKRVFERLGKYYCVDNLLVPGGEENDEKRLENLVYNELCRRYGVESVYYGQDENGYEVDFVVRDNKQNMYYQVCWQLNENNIKRELGNLDLGVKHGDGEARLLVWQNLTKDNDPRVVNVVEYLH